MRNGQSRGRLTPRGFRDFCDKPENIAAAWDEALAIRQPVVLEMITEPDIPPLLPHITLKQAKAFVSSLGQGDPNEASVIRKTIKEFAAELLPH